jgi:hypothetical protein
MKTIMYILLPLFICTASAGQASAQNNLKKCPSDMSEKFELSYSDGSGNTFHLKEGVLTYDPVTPAESSSGIYSGGDPWSTTLVPEKFSTLSLKLNEAIGKKSIHLKTRTMGSGLLILTSATGKSSKWILNGEDPLIAEIEALFRSFKP